MTFIRIIIHSNNIDYALKISLLCDKVLLMVNITNIEKIMVKILMIEGVNSVFIPKIKQRLTPSLIVEGLPSLGSD